VFAGNVLARASGMPLQTTRQCLSLFCTSSLVLGATAAALAIIAP
jgi:hypothetical protein